MKPSDGMLVSGSNYVRGTKRCNHQQDWSKELSKVLSSGEYAMTHICVYSSQLC